MDTAELPDFLVMIDRAGHAVVETVRSRGRYTVSAVDFGFATPAAEAIAAWLVLDDLAQKALAPVMNAYLTSLFEKYQH